MRFLLAVAVFLAAAGPALAADSSVNVGDDFYDPSTSSADAGDTITWGWSGSNDHTVTTRSGQIDRFNSGIKSGAGKSFRHRFRHSGRFRIFCQIHPDSMRATITVGTDDGVAPKLTGVSAGARKVGFTVSERSVVTLRLKGRRKIVKT